MNIKEIEERSGLVRANIRYYEKEGLLNPVRRENGYRDYSEDDLILLKRIRLMRELGISLEQIRELMENPQILDEVMNQRVRNIEGEVLGLDDAAAVCSEIRYDGASFDSMEADRYLERLEELACERNGKDDLPQQIREIDREPVQVWPWRRFLARMLDLQLCTWLWMFLWVVLLKQISGNGFFYSLLHTAAAMVLMVILEPFFLSYAGTTPGKWIFGLSVSDRDGKKLSYSDGAKRTACVLICGMSLHIPLAELFFLYRSYKKYTAGQGLSWEGSTDSPSEVSFCGRKFYQTAVLCALVLGIGFTGNFLLSTYQLIPPNRGDLTVEEFAENYNYYVDLMSRWNGESPSDTAFLDAGGQYLQNTADSAGTDEAMESGNAVISIDLFERELPVWEYKMEDGVISEISFEVDFSTMYLVSSYKDIMTCAILAAGGAWDQASILNRSGYELTKRTEEIGFGDYAFSDCGIQVSCQMEYDGEKIPVEQKDCQWIGGYQQGIHDFYMKFVMIPAESYGS